MSFELRLKLLYTRWQEIQKMRDDLIQLGKDKKDIDDKIKFLKKEIPLKLDEYNEVNK